MLYLILYRFLKNMILVYKLCKRVIHINRILNIFKKKKNIDKNVFLEDYIFQFSYISLRSLLEKWFMT